MSLLTPAVIKQHKLHAPTPFHKRFFFNDPEYTHALFEDLLCLFTLLILECRIYLPVYVYDLGLHALDIKISPVLKVHMPWHMSPCPQQI